MKPDTQKRTAAVLYLMIGGILPAFVATAKWGLGWAVALSDAAFLSGCLLILSAVLWWALAPRRKPEIRSDGGGKTGEKGDGRVTVEFPKDTPASSPDGTGAKKPFPARAMLAVAGIAYLIAALLLANN